MKYSDEVLRRVREPQRAGSLSGDHVGTGEVGTLDEGTVVRIQVKADGDRIAEARFKVFGCSAAIASASLVAEWLEGAAMDEASGLTAERVVQTLALAPERAHVARMAVEAGLNAVRDVTNVRNH
jgi:NifU-like protein involved in Fe-S cluster formation